MVSGTLMTFDELKARYDLPNTHFFRYLQLRHAFLAQFGGDPLVLEFGDLESLARSETLPKTVSSLYQELYFRKLPSFCHLAGVLGWL